MKTFTAIVALAGITAALASCPNQCSGHGRCNEVDQCVCYKSAGTKAGQRESWTGADCSQRMCPYGRSLGYPSSETQRVLPSADSAVSVTGYTNDNEKHLLQVSLPNGLKVPFDLNVEFEILNFVDATGGTTLDGAGQIRYRRDVDAEFAMPVEYELVNTASMKVGDASTAHEVAVKVNGYDTATGLFFNLKSGDATRATLTPGSKWWVNVTYNDGYSYSTHDHNSLHQLEECSGRGACDRGTGVCACAPGYTGDACSRTDCPSDCSGHGVCQPIKRFATDASLTYAGWDADAEFACKCDNGYRGAACNQIECPSGTDPMGEVITGAASASRAKDCSGRGLCDYGTGVCKCFKGFFGERCESLSNMV